MNRDYSVSFIRVWAMLFIVICHVANYFGYSTLAQFFNVGVQIFFMISGYLYGNRVIDNTGYWLYKRYIRLEVPAIIWLIMICISASIRKTTLPALHECVFLLLNLEGLNFIFSNIKDLFIGPWFFTNIMCCYLLLLCYLRIEKKHPNIINIFSNGGFIPLLLFIALAMCRISTDGALAFFIGFALKRKKLLEVYKRTNGFIAIVCCISAVTLRLIGKHYIDGSVFYDEVIAPGTHVMIAASFVVGVKWLFGIAPKTMESLSDNKFMQHLDKISIYVYISHDMLFGVFEWSLPVPVLAILFISIVILVASMLWIVGEFATRQIDRAVNYLFI